MKLLVIGATGGTGREIVRQAAAGHEVTALARSEGREAMPGARLIVGDARDVASLRRAVAGQDAVADSLGSGMSGPFKEVTVFSESTKALIEAMTAEGVRRLVCITGIGAGDSRGHGGFLYDHVVQPVLLRGVYADKDRQEALIRASGLDWVIVRPAMLADGPAVGGTRALMDLEGVHGGTNHARRHGRLRAGAADGGRVAAQDAADRAGRAGDGSHIEVGAAFRPAAGEAPRGFATAARESYPAASCGSARELMEPGEESRRAVLITRPAGDAVMTAERVRALGRDPVVAPELTVEMRGWWRVLHTWWWLPAAMRSAPFAACVPCHCWRWAT